MPKPQNNAYNNTTSPAVTIETSHLNASGFFKFRAFLRKILFYMISGTLAAVALYGAMIFSASYLPLNMTALTPNFSLITYWAAGLIGSTYTLYTYFIANNQNNRSTYYRDIFVFLLCALTFPLLHAQALAFQQPLLFFSFGGLMILQNIMLVCLMFSILIHLIYGDTPDYPETGWLDTLKTIASSTFHFLLFCFVLGKWLSIVILGPHLFSLSSVGLWMSTCLPIISWFALTLTCIYAVTQCAKSLMMGIISPTSYSIYRYFTDNALHQSVAAANVKRSFNTITRDDLIINGLNHPMALCFSSNNSDTPWLIYLHGNASHVDFQSKNTWLLHEIASLFPNYNVAMISPPIFDAVSAWGDQYDQNTPILSVLGLKGLLQSRYPNAKIAFMGHSMGGAIIDTAISLLKQEQIDMSIYEPLRIDSFNQLTLNSDVHVEVLDRTFTSLAKVISTYSSSFFGWLAKATNYNYATLPTQSMNPWYSLGWILVMSLLLCLSMSLSGSIVHLFTSVSLGSLSWSNFTSALVACFAFALYQKCQPSAYLSWEKMIATVLIIVSTASLLYSVPLPIMLSIVIGITFLDINNLLPVMNARDELILNHPCCVVSTQRDAVLVGEARLTHEQILNHPNHKNIICWQPNMPTGHNDLYDNNPNDMNSDIAHLRSNIENKIRMFNAK